MPSGLTRFYGSGDLHFITFSCFHRQPLLNTAERRGALVVVLEKMRVRYRFVILAYVVMPEHVHLLMSEPQEATPSVVIQAVKLGFAYRFPAPHVWQRRFYDFNIWSERKRMEKIGYIHQNPVTRGLVERPEDWRWSSYRSHTMGEPGVVKLNDTSVFSMKIQAA